MNKSTGFSLAELLITLAILGLVAAFTIPKVLFPNQNQKGRFNASANAVAVAVMAAYENYKMNNPTIPTTFGIKDITPYINYVKTDTASTVDAWPTDPSITFTCNAVYPKCLQLHNGGIIMYWPSDELGANTTLNAVPFVFDPDPTSNTGTTNGPNKSVEFFLHADGRIKTYASIANGTTYWIVSTGAWDVVNQDANKDPSWFSWL